MADERVINAFNIDVDTRKLLVDVQPCIIAAMGPVSQFPQDVSDDWLAEKTAELNAIVQ